MLRWSVLCFAKQGRTDLATVTKGSAAVAQATRATVKGRSSALGTAMKGKGPKTVLKPTTAPLKAAPQKRNKKNSFAPPSKVSKPQRLKVEELVRAKVRANMLEYVNYTRVLRARGQVERESGARMKLSEMMSNRAADQPKQDAPTASNAKGDATGSVSVGDRVTSEITEAEAPAKVETTRIVRRPRRETEAADVSVDDAVTSETTEASSAPMEVKTTRIVRRPRREETEAADMEP